MRNLANGLRASFENTASVRHALSKGEMREAAVERILRPHIPKRFDLSSGEVVNADGGTSMQQDVVILDTFAGTPFIAEGRSGTHPIETVTATLQVKSKITPSQMPGIVSNLASVKELLSDGPRPLTQVSSSGIVIGQTSVKPLTAVVAFEASGDAEALANAWCQANAALPFQLRTNALYVVDRLTILWGTKEEMRADAGPDLLATVYQGPDISVVLLYMLLMSHLQSYQPPPLELASYVNAWGLAYRYFGYRVDPYS